MPNDNIKNIEQAMLSIAQAIKANNISFSNNRYKFRISKTSAQNTTAAAFAKVLLNSITHDTSGGFDAVTNYRFTAPVSGYYFFSARVNMGTANSTILIASLYKNGTEHTRGQDHRAIAASRGTTVADIIYLAKNDYVELFVYCDVAIAMDVSLPAYNYLSGFLISMT